MRIASRSPSYARFAARHLRERRGIALAVLGPAALCALACAGDDAVEKAAAPPPEDVVPAARGALVELGRRIFVDPAASSRMGMRSCADCHDPAHGFSDPARTSLDDTAPTARHSQTLVDDGGDATAHWDGAFSTIDGLVSARLRVTFTSAGDGYYRPEPVGREGDAVIAASAERDESVPVLDDALDASAPQPVAVEALPAVPALAGLPGAREAADALAPTFVNRKTAWRSEENAPRRLTDHGRYAEAFREAYGTDRVTVARLSQAVAEYCRSIRSGSSPFDRFAAGDPTALGPAATRGFDLFRGRAGCVACHAMAGPRALFTDRDFHDTGIAWRSRPPGQYPTDDGRHARTGRAQDFRRFKTPTLRDVARRGPYMHDGSLATLEDVVRCYASEAPSDPNLDPRFPRFSADGTEVADLAAFLRALTSDRRPGLAPAPWRARAARTRLEFVDGYGEPFPRLEGVLVAAGDVLPGFSPSEDGPRPFTTDASGAVEFAPGRTTHVRVVLASGLPLLGGDLVVDTCRGARLIVAVAGRAYLSVPVAEGVEPPPTLEARHLEAATFPDHRVPRTVLTRATVAEDGAGPKSAWYEGPRRLDAGSRVEFAWPAKSGPPTTLRGELDRAIPPMELTLRGR